MAFRGRNGQASLRRLLKLLEPNLFGRGCPTLTVHMLHFHWPLTLPKTPLLNPALRRMSGTPPCLRRGTQSGTKLPISDTQRGTHRPKMFRPSRSRRPRVTHVGVPDLCAFDTKVS